jgi:hypothetical protein
MAGCRAQMQNQLWGDLLIYINLLRVINVSLRVCQSTTLVLNAAVAAWQLAEDFPVFKVV